VRPEKAAELHAKLVAWRTATNAPMPTKNGGGGDAPEKKKKGGKKRAERAK
jgi:hypothetical protein